ncbi:universal stress protein [Saliphagus sp. GCM10025334]
MYERILLPTDGSETTGRALEHAIDLANQYDAALHVLYVIDKAVFAGDVETGPIVEQFETVGDSVLEDVSGEAARAGVEPVITTLERGSPHTKILEYAESQGIDMIVMGTHGRTGLDRYLIGSVAEKVVRLSDAPVLTVRQAEDVSGGGER